MAELHSGGMAWCVSIPKMVLLGDLTYGALVLLRVLTYRAWRHSHSWVLTYRALVLLRVLTYRAAWQHSGCTQSGGRLAH